MRKAGGGTKLQLLIALVITAAIILGAIRIIPVYVRSYEFEDFMRAQAKFAGVEQKPADLIRQELLQKAAELELPISREQIQVLPRRGGVHIAANYSIQVDLVLYQPYLDFDFTADTATAY